jgi:hypothetical protein
VIALQTTDPFSRQRGRLRKKIQVIVSRRKKSKIKSGQGPQREARYPDELVGCLSAVRRTPTATHEHSVRLRLTAGHHEAKLCRDLETISPDSLSPEPSTHHTAQTDNGLCRKVSSGTITPFALQSVLILSRLLYRGPVPPASTTAHQYYPLRFYSRDNTRLPLVRLSPSLPLSFTHFE